MALSMPQITESAPILIQSPEWPSASQAAPRHTQNWRCIQAVSSASPPQNRLSRKAWLMAAIEIDAAARPREVALSLLFLSHWGFI